MMVNKAPAGNRRKARGTWSAKRVSVALLLTTATLFPAHAAKPYPQDVRRAITQSCVGLDRQMVAPCRCILRRLEQSIPFEQYEQLLKRPDPMADPRVQAIMRQCANPS